VRGLVIAAALHPKVGITEIVCEDENDVRPGGRSRGRGDGGEQEQERGEGAHQRDSQPNPARVEGEPEFGRVPPRFGRAFGLAPPPRAP
jgi:hypothetical protein